MKSANVSVDEKTTKFGHRTAITSSKKSRRHWLMLWPRQRWNIKQWWRLSFSRLELATDDWGVPFCNEIRYTHVNKYKCTIDQELAERCHTLAGQVLVFVHQAAVFCCGKWRRDRHLGKRDIKSKIWLHQSIHIYMKNIPVKFHHNTIWNDGALGFLDQAEEWLPQQE